MTVRMATQIIFVDIPSSFVKVLWLTANIPDATFNIFGID